MYVEMLQMTSANYKSSASFPVDISTNLRGISWTSRTSTMTSIKRKSASITIANYTKTFIATTLSLTQTSTSHIQENQTTSSPTGTFIISVKYIIQPLKQTTEVGGVNRL